MVIITPDRRTIKATISQSKILPLPAHGFVKFLIRIMDIIIIIIITNNTLYTETRYNDKIRYNDNLTVTKPSLKMLQLVTKYVRILYLII